MSRCVRTVAILALVLTAAGASGQVYPLAQQDPAAAGFSQGGNSHNLRGWRFTCNATGVVVTELGCCTLISPTYAQEVVLYDFSTQALIAQVTIVPGPGWRFEPLGTPVPLVQGSDYIVAAYCPGGLGNSYYFRSFTPPSPWLPTGDISYVEMRYSNGQPPSVFPTSVLNNYQYGVPDIGYSIGTTFIRTVLSASIEVAPGETGIPVTVEIENTGADGVDVSALDLLFFDAGAVDVSSEYTWTPDPGNPVAIPPVTLEVFNFSVDVGSNPTLGAITVDATGTFINQVSAASETDSGADTTHQWDVRGAEPMVRTVDAVDPEVAQGGVGYDVSVTIENVGLAEMTVTAINFTFTGSADRTSEYTVTPDPLNPTTIAAGVLETFMFEVDVDPAATVEVVTIDAGVDGTTTLSGAPVSDVDADTTDSWNVLVCAATICGDCSGDGVVGIVDALTAAQHSAGILVLAGSQFTNCNVEGLKEPDPGAEVTILDALRLAQFAAGLVLTLTCC